MKSVEEIRQDQAHLVRLMEERLLLQGGKTIRELVNEANRKKLK